MEVATRTLTLLYGDDNIQIPVRIFSPEQREPRAWSCRYEIDWPEGKEITEIWGVDSVQAMVLTLQAIGSNIYTSTYHQSGHLFFDVPGQGYGFPVPISLRDLLIGQDANYL
jgi:hypothetical protein